MSLFLFCVISLLSPSAFTQTSTGELHLHVADSTGSSLPANVEITADAQHTHQQLPTDGSGNLTFSRLPFGKYRISIQSRGFDPQILDETIRSSFPLEMNVVLSLAGVQTSVEVKSSGTLMDVTSPGESHRIGSEQIARRSASLPGRGVIDLVDSEPGWLYEGNAVLHPRGSEYQTQFVLNGVPLTENRSPGSGSELSVDDVQSMNIYTAGIPAEYGRKLGGVVEVNTLKDIRQGFHGNAVVSGGSLSTFDSYLQAQYGLGKNQVNVSGDGAYTEWYENPPVVENFTNRATTGSLSADFQREISNHDRLTLAYTHEFARFLVPNERVQETAGQRQHRQTLESLGTASWQHIFSSSFLGNISAMVRDDSARLSSNPASTPILASQNRGFREGYLKGSITADHGRHEWKAGFETDLLNLRERFDYTITDPTQFDPGTPATFHASVPGEDREEALFLEDTAHWKKWNLSAGLRWDNYSLLVHQSAFSPRLAVSRSLFGDKLMFHLSYDRVFQTPAIENLLISSSPEVVSLNPSVLRLPVRPSLGNYYETGVSKSFWSRLRLDTDFFVRRMSNFADDNPLLDTSITFPISFGRASIYGIDSKAEIAHWAGISGFLSYSYMVGSAYLPITGGLFLGESSTATLDASANRFWVSQDQRHTANSRWRYQLPRGFWLAIGGQYGSGLPEEFSGTQEQAVALYGRALTSRVNFNRGRVRPSMSLDSSAGLDLPLHRDRALHLVAGMENLTDRLNLIDFQGLFSGNAVAPPRRYNLRLTFTF